MNRWVLYLGAAIVGVSWMCWAAPRWHPAPRLSLQMDRDAYLAKARQIASANGMAQQTAAGSVKVSTQSKNQYLRQQFPSDPVARMYPAAEVEINLNSLPESSVTLRPEGSVLAWKLPPAKTPRAGDPSQIAAAAMEQIAGGNAAAFSQAGATAASADERTFTWRAPATNAASAKNKPEVTIEVTVKNGYAHQAVTNFLVPESVSSRLDRISTVRFGIGICWFLVVLIAIVIPLLKEGSIARAMKDWAVLRLSALLALGVGVGASIEWDSALVSSPEASGPVVEFLGILVAVIMFGVLFYAIGTVAILNARLHAGGLRSFRLLATRAIVSRLVGRDILGGLLFAPLFAGLPLFVAALLHVPLFRSYDDSAFLNPAPVLDAIAAVSGQDMLAVLALLGVMLPLSIRYSSRPRLRWTILAGCVLLTTVMLGNQFRTSLGGTLASASLAGALLFWLYTRFGVLGALLSYSASALLDTGIAFSLQPAYSLHSAGQSIFWVLALATAAAAIVSWKGSETAVELYGESAVRIESRTRREEILAGFNVARSAQQKMLPSQMPSLPGYSVSASCDPAREVGGDLYDFLSLREGKIGIGVADVSGKGVPAALYMTFTKGLLCAASQDSDDPRAILGVVNTHLREVTRKKMFVTMALGVLDPASATVEYARAGHNPVVWRRRALGETRMLAGAGIGLGIAPPSLFARTLAVEQLQLSPGDALVFYSDGLTEAMNGIQEQFGDDRLMAAVARTDGMHAFQSRDSILGEVKQFLNGIHPQDDLTIAVLRMNES